MYGGVGLPSAKGTGTNGFVERALGYLPKDYKPGSYGEIIRQMKSNPAPIKRKINDEIILHEEKHKIEVELYDLKEKYLKEKKYKEKEIEEKINNERKRLYRLLERREADFMDKNETHQKGKLKDAQMKIIKNALKIKDEYYLGEGFEYGLQADMDKIKKKKEKKKNEKRKSKHYKHDKSINDYYDEKYGDNNYRKRIKDYYRKEYRDRSSSISRSRSRSKNYNKNIKKELNIDYRLKKKYKLVESVFKRSPSHKEENNDKLNNKENEKNIDNNNIVENDKEKSNNNNNEKEKDLNNLENNLEKNLNNNLNKKEETNIKDIIKEEKNNKDDEHEEGSIDN